MRAMGMAQETLDALKAIHARGGVAFKDITTALGYQWYDLQPIVDRTFPQITPVRDFTPRLPGVGGDSTHWKEVYQINANSLSAGVSERNRNAAVATSLRDRFAKYAELELEDFVTWKSDLEAGKLTPEVKAMAVENLTYAMLQQEEFILLLGNTGVAPAGSGFSLSGGNGVALGTCPTPVASLVAGGSMTAQATSVYCVALTPEGLLYASLTGGLCIQQHRTNVDGTTDVYGGGTSQVSAASNTITTAGGNLSITAHVAPVKGAVAYAWFFGLQSGGASVAFLGAITSINSVAQTADPNVTPPTPATGFSFTANSFSADHSGNGLVFDGYMTQTIAGGGLWVAQPTGADGVGTPLTADTHGGITEIDADLLSIWNTTKAWPTRILVSAQERGNITQKIVNSGAFRINADASGKRDGLSGGQLVRTYLSKYSMNGGNEIPIELHPNMPAGTIMYMTEKLPYRIQNMAHVANIRYLQEYRQIEWPITKRSWDFAVSVTETLEMHFPIAFGIRTNIANG